MTLADIAAMDTVTIGTREAAAVTGKDRYTINLHGKEGRPWMGCTVHMTGKKGTRAVLIRAEFLEKMGWKGAIG